LSESAKEKMEDVLSAVTVCRIQALDQGAIANRPDRGSGAELAHSANIA